MAESEYPERYAKLADSYEKDAHWARSPEDRKHAELHLTILRELAAAEKLAKNAEPEFVDPKCCVWVSDAAHFGGTRLAHDRLIKTRGHSEHRPRTREEYEADIATDS